MKLTKEHRRKLSESHKGMKKPWVKGFYGFTEEANKKRVRNLPRGDKHWAWKGGITHESMKVRNSGAYKTWRNQVFSRDKYTCQECGNTGCYIEAHHIEKFSENHERRLDISNGITLCKDCHAKKDGHVHVMSKLTREKIRKALIGRKMSVESRKKMSESKKGIIPWNKGIKKQRHEMICEWCGHQFTQKRNCQILCSRICTNQRNGNIKKRLRKDLLENGLISLTDTDHEQSD